ACFGLTMKKRRVLTATATGKVRGAALPLLQQDARDGHLELVGAVRTAQGAEKLRREGSETVSLDFDAPATLRPALEGVYAWLLLTGYSVDMLAHSKRLLDAAKAEGVDHIVHLGAMAADDTPYAPLAWHQLIERAIEAMNFS